MASAIVLSFDRGAQPEAPLRAAADRMAGIAACQIDVHEGRWACTFNIEAQEAAQLAAVRERFLAILNDENLREQIEQRTAPARDVIVALAFGALARAQESPA